MKRKVQLIAKSYYARKDVQNAIFEFCKNRETIPNYNNEFFGKRPDCLDYPNDVFRMAKNGATSFHCSQELWQNPLDIKTDMTQEEYNKIRIGWDFLIDIDSKYLDYSKIAAKLLIKALEYHGVENIGVKFSGSKGLHILIPWKAFPKEVYGEKTKDHFPEWPRLIAGYLQEMIHDKLTEEILKLHSKASEKEMFEVIYKPTNEKAVIKKMIKYVCSNPQCRTEVNSMVEIRKKTIRCPSCKGDLKKVGEKEVYVAESNKDNSEKHPELFEKRPTIKSVIDSVDIVLVSSRHLFRAPYSLHEKTALASVVIDKEEIENFKPSDADPLKVEIKDFNPNCKEGEAKELLLQALDWAKKKEPETKKFTGKSIDVKNLTITEDMFPDCIKKILEGVKHDGRKRCLSILLAFFSTLGFPRDYIETKIEEWNKKNYKCLRQGYIKSQIEWYLKNPRMPPNYDKPIYRELNILGDTHGVKNPINFTIKQAIRAKALRKQNPK